MLNLRTNIKTPAIFLFIAFSVFFIIGANGAEVSSVEDILPAGTRMVIPAEIMQEYQSVSEEWRDPFNYLSHYYSSLGPSTLYKDQHTYYIPLIREAGKTTGQTGSRTVMVDLMNVQMNKGDTTFTTVRDSYIINWKNVFIAVVDVSAWNNIFKPSLLTADK